MSTFKDKFNVTWSWDRQAIDAATMMFTVKPELPYSGLPDGGAFTMPGAVIDPFGNDGDVQNEIDKRVANWEASNYRPPAARPKSGGGGALLLGLVVLLLIASKGSK